MAVFEAEKNGVLLTNDPSKEILRMFVISLKSNIGARPEYVAPPKRRLKTLILSFF